MSENNLIFIHDYFDIPEQMDTFESLYSKNLTFSQKEELSIQISGLLHSQRYNMNAKRAQLYDNILNQAYQYRKKFICSAWMRGFCTFPSSDCMHAHGVSDLIYIREDFSYDAESHYESIDSRQLSNTLNYVYLYEFCQLFDIPDLKDERTVISLQSVNDNRTLRTSIREHSRTKLFEEFFLLLKRTYPDVFITETFLSKEFSRVGVGSDALGFSIKSKRIAGYLIRHMCYIARAYHPPSTNHFMNVLMIRDKRLCLHAYFQEKCIQSLQSLHEKGEYLEEIRIKERMEELQASQFEPLFENYLAITNMCFFMFFKFSMLTNDSFRNTILSFVHDEDEDGDQNPMRVISFECCSDSSKKTKKRQQLFDEYIEHKVTDPKLQLCRYWLRGLCIFNAQQCQYAHGVSDLVYSAYSEIVERSDSSFDDFLSQKPLWRVRSYVSLFREQEILVIKGIQDVLVSQKELDDDKELRENLREKMQSNAMEEFIELIWKCYGKHIIITQSFLLREFTRVGFFRIGYTLKLPYIIEIITKTKCFAVETILPPSIHPTLIILPFPLYSLVVKLYSPKVLKVFQEGQQAKQTRYNQQEIIKLQQLFDGQSNIYDKGDQPGQNIGDQPGQNIGDKPGQNIGDNLGQNKGDKPGQNIGDKPRPRQNIGDKPGKNIGDKPGQIGDKPGQNIGDKLGQNIGDKPGQNIGDKQGHNIVDKSRQNIGEKQGQNRIIGGEQNINDIGEKQGQKRIIVNNDLVDKMNEQQMDEREFSINEYQIKKEIYKEQVWGLPPLHLILKRYEKKLGEIILDIFEDINFQEELSQWNPKLEMNDLKKYLVLDSDFDNILSLTEKELELKSHKYIIQFEKFIYKIYSAFRERIRATSGFNQFRDTFKLILRDKFSCEIFNLGCKSILLQKRVILSSIKKQRSKKQPILDSEETCSLIHLMSKGELEFKKSDLNIQQRIIIVDTKDAIESSQLEIRRHQYIGVDLEGNLSKKGKIELVQFSCYDHEKGYSMIYVFDCLLMEKSSELFEFARKTIQQIMEEKKITKILQGSQKDALALAHLFKCRILNGVDVQVVHNFICQLRILITSLPNAKKNTLVEHKFFNCGLNSILSMYNAPNGLNPLKNKFHDIFADPQRCHDYLNFRPIHDDFLIYSSKDVEDLVPIYFTMLKQADSLLKSLLKDINVHLVQELLSCISKVHTHYKIIEEKQQE